MIGFDDVPCYDDSRRFYRFDGQATAPAFIVCTPDRRRFYVVSTDASSGRHALHIGAMATTMRCGIRSLDVKDWCAEVVPQGAACTSFIAPLDYRVMPTAMLFDGLDSEDLAVCLPHDFRTYYAGRRLELMPKRCFIPKRRLDVFLGDATDLGLMLHGAEYERYPADEPTLEHQIDQVLQSLGDIAASAQEDASKVELSGPRDKPVQLERHYLTDLVLLSSRYLECGIMTAGHSDKAAFGWQLCRSTRYLREHLLTGL